MQIQKTTHMTAVPRISIVLPVHNDEETVVAALESCLAQTMPDVEIICVDDASTDDTSRAIEEVRSRDSRVRLIRQERNLSALQARRTGVLAAAAKYVLFLDGDDELMPDAAQKALATADEHDPDLVGFAVEVVDPAGRVVGGYQSRLTPKHVALEGDDVLSGLFPIGEAAQGQLWRFLFRTQVLRDAYNLLPEDLVLPRVNDLPLLYLVAALAQRYVSVPDRLYRYHFGRGRSGRGVASLAEAEFQTEAIRSVDSIRPAVRALARKSGDPGALLDNYESVRMSTIGYVCWYLVKHTDSNLLPAVLEHLHTCASATDVVIAAAKFYPDALPALKNSSTPVRLPQKAPRSVLLTTRALTTGGVSGVLATQAELLMRAGHRVTIVARRPGSHSAAVPPGAEFIEMLGRGLPERLVEWAEICRQREIDVIIDHQVLYSRDWPEYALTARTLGVPTIGWLHNFAGRPLYDLNGMHALLTDNATLLETLVTLSPLDVAFWKIRGVEQAVYLPNPPSPLLLKSSDVTVAKRAPEGRLNLIWWGRLEERTKKVSELLAVAEQLRKLTPDFHLTVIGPDWEEWTAERFNALARTRGIDAHVAAVGPRQGKDLIDAIDAADAFICTSIIEGYPLTIAEAQARGLPVFMYQLPWLALAEGNGGIVAVPQGDSAGLARQIAGVFESAERYIELSRLSLIAAERERSRDFAELYDQVITGELPPEYSPEPTFADATRLLDLMIFFAEQNAGVHAELGAARNPPKPTPSPPATTTGSFGYSLAQRTWRTAKPIGRIVLQIAPGLRRYVHRARVRFARLRR